MASGELWPVKIQTPQRINIEVWHTSLRRQDQHPCQLWLRSAKLERPGSMVTSHPSHGFLHHTHSPDGSSPFRAQTTCFDARRCLFFNTLAKTRVLGSVCPKTWNLAPNRNFPADAKIFQIAPTFESMNRPMWNFYELLITWLIIGVNQQKLALLNPRWRQPPFWKYNIAFNFRKSWPNVMKFDQRMQKG